MTKKKDGPTEQAISISLDDAHIRLLDQHIKNLTADIPGATISRHSWARAIIIRELEKAAKGGSVPEGAHAADTDRGQIGHGRGD